MTATQELIRDLKLWACSPRVPTNAQLVSLAITRCIMDEKKDKA